jgi:hypothetical protein
MMDEWTIPSECRPAKGRRRTEDEEIRRPLAMAKEEVAVVVVVVGLREKCLVSYCSPEFPSAGQR